MKSVLNFCKQHYPILKAFEKQEYTLILVIGGRSSAKSTDTAQFGVIRLVENIKLWTKKSKQYKIMLMRKNYGSIAKSIGFDFWSAYKKVANIKELAENTSLLETEIKGKNKVGETWVFFKGFRSSSKSDTAVTKGFSNINTIIIDEAEEISQKEFQQLEGTAIRENTKIVMICNTPHKDHWICKKYLNLLPSQYEGFNNFEAKPLSNFVLVKSTVKGNSFLTKEAREMYDTFGDKNSLNYDLNRYCKDVLGLVTGDLKGKIFKNYSICPDAEFDDLDTQSFFGMDFGFSNDPATLVECKIVNNYLYIKERFYQTGVTNPRTILESAEISKKQLIKADSGGLGVQLIAQLQEQGYNVQKADKGSGSVQSGILQMQNFAQIRICESSYNAINEFNTYTYKIDGNGNSTTEPNGKDDHIIDAIRYAIKPEVKPKHTRLVYF